MRFREVKPLLILLASLPNLSRADPRPRTLLIESYVGPRPRSVGPLVEKVREGTEVLSGEKLRAAIENEFARPVAVASSQAMEKLINRAAEGSAAFEAADFLPATAALTQVADGLARESASLIADPKLRETRKTALTTLALAYAKMRRFDAAKETLQELVRSYSEVRSFPEATFPPKIAELGAQVLKEKAERAGVLSVSTIPEGRKLYLNEEPIGDSPRTLNGLLPGKYRLFIPSARSDQAGSVRMVTVEPARRRTLLCATEVDEHLELNDYVGFSFPSDEDKQRFEIPLASALGQTLGAGEVLLINHGYSSEPMLLGAIYDSSNGRRVWGVLLPLSPAPSDKQVQSFVLSLRTRREITGTRLFDGRALEQRPPEMAATAPPPPPPPKAQPTEHADAKWLGLQSLGWAVFAAGIPTFLAGVSLLSRTGLGTCGSTTELCPTTYSDKTTATVLLSVGAAAIVDTPIYLALHDDYNRQLRNYGVAAIVQGATAMASGGLLLYYDQMPKAFTSNGVKIAPGYDTWAWASLGVGAATALTGIALTIADRYFHRRDRRSWDRPLVAVSLSGAGISLAGRF